MVCAYCLEDKKLIEAHIIPRPFHPPGTHEGETVILSGPDSSSYPKRSKSGVYDTTILCGACDGELGKLDQHAVELLLRVEPELLKHEGQIVAREYPDADPETVLRFAVSVAWRAHLSSHEMFKTVRLGPYAEKMRSFLRGEAHFPEFELVISEFHGVQGSFLNPHMTRFSGVNFLVIYAGRFIFYLKVDKRRLPTEFESGAVRVGRRVRSVVRDFLQSKEAGLMLMMLEQPKASNLRSKWERARNRQSDLALRVGSTSNE